MKKISLNITDELNEKIEIARKKQGLTKNAFLINLISNTLEQMKLIDSIQTSIADKFSDPDFIRSLVSKEIKNNKTIISD